MTFEELMGKVKTVRCQEIRAEQENYLEVVVDKAELPSTLFILEACFGPPLKPAGREPSKEAGRYADPCGGVRGNQTLYYRKTERGSELALLWPWGSGGTFTVKLHRQ